MLHMRIAADYWGQSLPKDIIQLKTAIAIGLIFTFVSLIGLAQTVDELIGRVDALVQVLRETGQLDQ